MPLCNLMRFIFTSACYFWTKKSAFVPVVSPMMHLSISIFTAWGCRKGGYWSGLMYPDCRAAQRRQTVCILSLPDWFLCRLAPVSPWKCHVLKWRRAIYLSCAALLLYDGWACASVCAGGDHLLPNPLLSLEKGERLRERGRGGRVMDAQYRRRRRGKRWKEASRKGGLRHKVGSIFFSYFLVWIEQWVRGNPKPCEWYFTSGSRGRRKKASKDQQLNSAAFSQDLAYWRSLFRSGTAAAHKERHFL